MQVNLLTTGPPAYTVTYNRGRIDKIESPDNEHLVARNI